MDAINQAVFENAHIGFWELNVPERAMQLSNVFKSMLGYQGNELKSKPLNWENLVFADDLEQVLDNYDKHIQSHGKTILQHEARYLQKNGSMIWLKCTGEVTDWEKDGTPHKVSGCVIDITRQKSTEYRLMKTENLLDLTNQVARVGGWEIDLMRKKARWSKVVKEIYEVPDNYEPQFDIITGRGSGFILHDASRKLIDDATNEAIQNGTSYNLEIKITTAKGKELWTRIIGHAEFENGICKRLYGTFQDIDNQKRMREEYEIGEQQFRSAFENATIGMALVSLDGKWMKVNHVLCDLLGYTREELMAITFQQITHPDDLEHDLGMVIKVLDGEINNYQIDKRYIHKDGSIIWALLSVSLVRDNGGIPLHFVSQIENVTLRRSAEMKLRESEAKYRKIFENVQDVFYQTDVHGIITEISPSIENYSGYKRDAVIGSHAGDFYYHPEDRQKLVDLLKQHGKVNDFQVRLKTNDDEIVHASINAHLLFDDDGTFYGFEGSMRDIRERKKAEDALKERDALLTKLSEQIPGMIYQFQFFPDGRSCFPFASNGGIDLFGLTPQEIKYDSAPVFKRIHPDDFAVFYQSVITSFNTLTRWEHEFRLVMPDQSVKWLHGASRPELQADKSVIWHGYVTDITDKKVKEQELQKAFELVTQQNNRLINFAYIISHNLRTHSGNFEMLVKLFRDAENREEELVLLGHIEKVSDQLSETVMHLNEVVSIQTNISQHRTPLNLYTYVEKAIAILKNNSSYGDTVIANQVAPGLEIEYNPAYIESILFNFLSNALKYGDPDKQTMIEVSSYVKNGHQILKIADNGLGIDLQKNSDKLFGMYKTFHENSDGKGIGLFITKNQVEAMGGKIEVSSEVGQGTTFKIYLS
ncbi:PAS domain S-box protein [Mucilaginibacter sp. AW1-3]